MSPERTVPPQHVVPPRASEGKLALTEEELVAWGEALGRASHPPLVLLLSGELGSGKTTLAGAICRGYGVEERVTSPTYALLHRYHSPRGAVHHLDLYRLRGPEELTPLGWDDVLSERSLIIIEWPERAAGRLPEGAVRIVLEHLSEDADRRLLLAG